MKGKRFFPKQSILFISVLSLFLLPTSSIGATFCVGDETELQTALTTAVSNGEDNSIKIVQGTYNGNFTYASTEGNSLTMEGGYTEGCVSRTIAPANTILDGGGTDMVLALVSQGAAIFSVEGLTFQNGNATTVGDGGGLYIKTEGGNVILIDNSFTDNTANSYGGGTYISVTTSDGGGYISGTATLNNSVLSASVHE